MIVKVGDQKVDSSEHPVIIEFEPHELEMFKSLDPTHNVMYSYPEGIDEKKLEEWVTRRINEDWGEDIVPIHEGNGN